MSEEVDCIQGKVLKDQVNDEISDFFKRRHLDTIQNMPISLIDSSKKAYDFEIGESIICSIRHYKNFYKVLCEVLDNTIIKAKPGIVLERTVNAKRPASKDVATSLQSKKSNLIENNSIDCSDAHQSQQSNFQDTFSIENLLKLAEKNQFPKKEFTFGNKITTFTPKLHFFECETVFTQRPLESIKFKCKLCNRVSFIIN
jgi:hypothetical protein